MADFDKLSNRQKDLVQALNTLKSDFTKSNVIRRAQKAQEWLNALEDNFDEFDDNNNKLLVLNTDNEYDERTYFKSKLYENGAGIFEEMMKVLKELITPKQKDKGENEESAEQKAAFTREKLRILEEKFSTMSVDQQKTIDLLQRLLDEPKKIKKKTKKQISPSSSAAESEDEKEKQSGDEHLKFKDLLDAMVGRKNEMEFPTFPNDDTEYRDWRQQVDIWEAEEGPLTKDQTKMKRLKDACEKNSKAHAMTKSFDVTQTNFKECLKKLDKRFLVIRNVIYKMIDTLIELPRAKSSGENLMRLYDTITPTLINMNSLIKQHVLVIDDDDNEEETNLQVKATLYDAVISALINRKLDDATCTHIASKLKLQSKQIPDPQKVLEVIETKFINLQASQSSHTEQKSDFKNQTKSKATVSAAKLNEKGKKAGCLICGKNNHETIVCRRLTNLEKIPERWNLVREKSICANCLDAPRGMCQCYGPNGKARCQRCNYKHHTMLHSDDWKPKAKVVKNACTKVASVVVERLSAMIPTARVQVIGQNGDRKIFARAFLDTAASHTFITQGCLDRLRLTGRPTYAEVETYNGDLGTPIEKEVSLIISPHFKSNFELSVTAYVSESLGGNVPMTRLRNMNENIIPRDKRVDQCSLADPQYHIPRPIDLIIGVREFAAVIPDGAVNIKLDKSLTLLQTEFGYIYLGAAKADTERVVATKVTNVNFNQLAQLFEHDLEEEEKSSFSEEFYMKTVRRDETGYTVSIPWKMDRMLGDSKKMTMARVRGMMRRMSPEVLNNYIQQCDALKSQGYMVPAPIGKPARNYIANFALKTKSLTTPVRILFTCDQKTTNGKSVNDIQHCGPKLHNDLPSCLMKFRYNRVAVTGDITKMYLQIKVDPTDAAYQRTFIGTSADGPLEEMELPTVIFGMKSAPFLALRTLLHIADTVEKSNPVAAQLLRDNFYVDDLLASFENRADAVKGINQLMDSLKIGKFELKKIAASDKEVLKDIPSENTLDSISKNFDEESINEDVNVLGIMWDKRADILHYKVNVDVKDEKMTKRVATSIAGRLYDPTGCLAPALLGGKILIQEMWKRSHQDYNENDTPQQKKAKSKAHWDAPMPVDLDAEFRQWHSELPMLQSVKINRWVQHSNKNQEEMILGFADASTKAYGCVVYFRIVDERGQVSMTIIGAKSKVTPLAKNFVPANKEDELTLPRLELMAATMLAEYLRVIKTAFNETTKVIAFSDSKITLAWIQGDEERWNTFVCNRIKKIKAVVSADKWFYVNTKNNPADLASRSVRPSQMMESEESDLWFNGPTFTHKLELCCEEATYVTALDEKRKVTIAAVEVKINEVMKSLESYSSWTKSVRVMSYVLRIQTILLHKRRQKTHPRLQQIHWDDRLRVKEMVNAEQTIIRLYQQHHYAADIKLVSTQSTLQKSKLKQWAPFVGEDRILRVGGRLDEAKFISYNERHPMILPPLEIPKDRTLEVVETRSLTRKIIDWAHLTTLHGGELKTLAFIKQKFYIPNARNAIRYVLHRCLICSIQRADTYRQLMGNLPKECTNPAPPFYHTTLDYAGPIIIQYGARKTRSVKNDEQHAIKSKAWIAIFVCRLVGAYHIELVPNLTAVACVDAFKRFVSTRGLPKTVTSDNASTFKKAAKMMKDSEKKAFQTAIDAILEGEKEIQQQFAFKKVEVFGSDDVMQWKFIPPLSPNFGGKHEAAVKQVKIHLKKVIGENKLPFITLTTVLKEIEAILNSRPLCKIEGTTLERDQILTPAHFLIGRPLTAMPEPDYTCKVTMYDRHQTQMRMVQHFWKLWHTQYLTQLQHLPKWTDAYTNIQVGEIVLMKEPGTPPLTWRKARVTEVYPGNDEFVRVVLTHDAGQKDFKRSVRHIVRLPIVLGRGETAIAAGKTPVMPLIAPMMQQDDEPTTATANVNASKPVRRSSRIKNKMSAALLTMMCVISFMMPSGANYTLTSTSANTNGTGLTYFYKRDVMIQIGTQHIEINTDLTPEKDIGALQSKLSRYRDTCDRAAKKLNPVWCRAQLHELDIAMNNTVARIMDQTKYISMRRTKREFHKGIIPKLFNWLIGGWNDETEDDVEQGRSMGVLKHAISAFKNVEHQLDTKEKHLEKQLERLASSVNDQSTTVLANIRTNELSIQLIGVYELLLQHIHEVDRIYNNVEQYSLEGEDFDKVLQKIRETLPTGIIPNLDKEQWQELIHPKKQIKNKTVNVIINIPIVLEDKFKEYMVISLPMAHTSVIADGAPTSVIVNKKRQQFIEMIALKEVNETLAITARPVNVLQKVNINTNCFIKGILTGGGSCPVKKLPSKYDVWIPTPLHNQVAFYSTENKEIICKESRESINEKSGVITIPQGCLIETPTKQMIANQDRNSIQRHAFHVEMSEPEIQENIKDVIQTAIWADKKMNQEIDERELDEALKEAVGASQEFSSTQLTFIIVSAMCCTVALLASGYYIARVKINHRTPEPTASIYEAVELNELLKNTNPTNNGLDLEAPIPEKN